MADAAILDDPAWFPDRIDAGNRLVRLVRTRHDLLAESGFLDGRTPLAVDPAASCILGFDDFIGKLAPAPAIRWIAHESFCGSTLLARVVTIPDHGLCLREPQILTDLAEWRVGIADAELPLFRQILDATLSKLSQRWRPDERIAIKPSNWINPVLDEMWRPERGDRVVRVTIGREDFIVAVLRGGRDRIAYALRLYDRFSKRIPIIARTVTDALPDGEPMAQATCLIAAMHWAQDIMLTTLARAANAEAQADFRFPQFLDDPGKTAIRLVTLLDLTVPGDALANSLAANLPRHAKADGQAPVDEQEVNRRVRLVHGDLIAQAMRFATLLDERSELVAQAVRVDMMAQDATAG